MLSRLPPGEWSSQRHWHSHEDELVYILSGHPILIDDTGETELAPGDVTVHPAGDANGHHMINRTNEDVTFLIIGTHDPESDSCYYPDIDLESAGQLELLTGHFTRNRRITDLGINPTSFESRCCAPPQDEEGK